MFIISRSSLDTVTVTEALVLRPLLEDRGRFTESIRILVPVNRMEQKSFQITMKRVRRSQQLQLNRQPVPCSWCSNRKGSVADSSRCLRRPMSEGPTRSLGQGYMRKKACVCVSHRLSVFH